MKTASGKTPADIEASFRTHGNVGDVPIVTERRSAPPKAYPFVHRGAAKSRIANTQLYGGTGKRLSRVQFTVMSYEEMLDTAVCEIDQRAMYSGDPPTPARGGVLDPRLGTCDKSMRCKTCSKDLNECSGHFGIINLAMPVWHVGYFKYVIQILQSICKSCSHILLEPPFVEKYLRRMTKPHADAIFLESTRKSILEQCKKAHVCPHCGAANGTVRKASNASAMRIVHDIYATSAFADIPQAMSGRRDEVIDFVLRVPSLREPLRRAPDTISPHTALILFEQIPERYFPLLWCDAIHSPPQNLILRGLLVPPVVMRLSVKVDGGAGTNEDDLTTKLQEIVTFNLALKKDMMDGAPIASMSEKHDTLTNAIAQYTNGAFTNPAIAATTAVEGSSRSSSTAIARKATKKGPFGLGSYGMHMGLGDEDPDMIAELAVMEEDEMEDDDGGEMEANKHVNAKPNAAATKPLPRFKAPVTTTDSGTTTSGGGGGGGSSASASKYRHNKTGISRRPIRGLVQRIKGKQGRFRGNLSGKRVDFSGRTVISPDPNLGVHEVGIPLKMAMRLTYPVLVNTHNLAYLRTFVANGEMKYPGANYVKVNGREMRSLPNTEIGAEVAATLNVGDVVERHLIDGDIVLFNRQPSLHRQSIMCHLVRVLDGHTLRFNECVCAPYNADFDGDEMNIHVPQTEEARAEALELMRVGLNLVSPRNGEPLVAATQDFITSSYLMTRKDTFMWHAQFLQTVYGASDCKQHVDIPPPAILKPVPMWTGKQAWSTILKRLKCDGQLVGTRHMGGVSLTVREKYFNTSKIEGTDRYLYDDGMCPNEGWVEIHDGELICGALGKSSLGASKGSVFFALLRDFGAEAAVEAMNRMTKMCPRWLANHGFSFGVDDVRPSVELLKDKTIKIENAFEQCAVIVSQFHANSLAKAPGMTLEETMEAKISQVLSQVREDVGDECMRSLPGDNSAFIMATCGSKGSSLNICQMMVCVGQQIVGGHRIPDGFLGRTLPHFTKPQAKSPMAKGFVESSFYHGLNPTEFFFHTMAGREGLVDTAVKTAETGYMARRLMKAMEDLTVCYDGTVRDASGCLVQFAYGDDGLSPGEMDSNGYMVDFTRLGKWMRTRKQDELLGFARDHEGLAQVVVGASSSPREHVLMMPPPRNDHQYIDDTMKWVHDNMASFLARKQSLEKPDFYTRCVLGNEDPVQDFGRVAFLKKLRKEIQSLIQRGDVNRGQLLAFVCRAVRMAMKAVTDAGEAIGALGATSLGEPGTQMTLKTFHFAGVGSKNVTLGVPRLKEVINGTKTISTPIVNVSLTRDDDISAYAVHSRLEATYLKDLLIKADLAWSCPDPCILLRFADENVFADLSLEHLTMEVIARKIVSKGKAIKLGDKEPQIMKRVWIDDHNREIGVVLDLHAPASDGKLKDEVFPRALKLRADLSNILIWGVDGLKRAVVIDKSSNVQRNVLVLEKHWQFPWDENMAREQDLGPEPVGVKPNHKPLAIYVEGTSDLLQVMGVWGVDASRTTTNDVWQTYEVLGIEAARAVIIREIKNIFDRYGLGIDSRHLTLLADVMTYKGMVLGITRFGIAKMKESVLMLASFEKSADILFAGAAHGRADELKGVSENIIVGGLAPIGTGVFDLLEDLEFECE